MSVSRSMAWSRFTFLLTVVPFLELPNEQTYRDELDKFADEARRALFSSNFSQKQAIVLNVVDKIVGTPRQLPMSLDILFEGFFSFSDHDIR